MIRCIKLRETCSSDADTKVAVNPFVSRGDLAVVPTAILATAKDRLEVEARGRASVAAEQDDPVSTGGGLRAVALASRLAAAAAPAPEPLPAATIFSPGVFLAMQTGELAAGAILRAFRTGRFEARRFRGYERRSAGARSPSSAKSLLGLSTTC